MAHQPPTSRSQKYLALTIFSSRWLQAPLYLGLIVAQAIYVYQFIIELTHLLLHVRRIGENEIMLIVLGLIDVVMISNLLIMVIIGGYETFVSRLDMDNHPDSPEWLSHVNSNTMKIKLSLALIGISSIHLLKAFFNMDKITDKAVMWQVIIHITLLVSSRLCSGGYKKVAKFGNVVKLYFSPTERFRSCLTKKHSSNLVKILGRKSLIRLQIGVSIIRA